MEALSRIPCDDDPSCKYYETGCFEDIHHLYSRVGATCLEMVFRELPENKIRICRADHEFLEREAGWEQYPTREVMRQAIVESPVYLSARKRKRILGHE